MPAGDKEEEEATYGLAVEARRARVGVVHAAPVDANLPRHGLRRLGVALVAHAVDADEAVDGVLREEESRMSDQMAAAGRLGRRTRDWGLTRAPCAAAAAMQADADSARRGVIL